MLRSLATEGDNAVWREAAIVAEGPVTVALVAKFKKLEVALMLIQAETD